MSVASPEARIESASELADESRQALRDLVLSLADSKRVLGLRYSDRMLGAPTLEAGIAASSMAQDEWGHARLTYALLGDFGDEPKELEHERPAAEYRSHPALDAGFETWSDFIACILLIDTALATQYGALADGRYTPALNRVQKMLDEERFHFQYAAGWVRKIASIDELRPELQNSLSRYMPQALQWLGDDAAAGTQRLTSEGLSAYDPATLRQRFLSKVGPVLEEIGMADALDVSRGPEGFACGTALDWTGWNERTRRTSGELDEVTAARARGDKNRALLLD